MKRVFAEVITIGDEILIGQVTDTNSAWLGQNLNPAGIEIKQITSVSDDADHIMQAIDDARGRVDILILTGGLGPTRDDITKKTLADYFGAGLITDERALAMVTELFVSRNLPLLDINKQQALIPDNCTPIYNDRGTAPGMWFEDKGQVLVSLPGVPYEMKHMMTHFVIPRLQERFEMPFIRHRTLLTSGIGESFLAKKIEAIELGLPSHIKLAYLPNYSTVRLRFSGHSGNLSQLENELEDIAERIKKRIPEYLAAEEDKRLEEVVSDLLLKKGATMGTAESCTGGMIAHLITSLPGSSAKYKGSVVCYDNSVKTGVLGVDPADLEKHGAVSEAVVIQMAEGARRVLKADYTIATSGVAGPDGGTPEKPVGTVWMAVSGPEGTEAKVFHFRGDRLQIIERSAMTALDMLRKKL